MAIALLTHLAAGSADSNGFTTASLDSTGATLLVVGVVEYSGVGAGTLSDSKSNSWTQIGSTLTGATNLRFRMYYSLPTSVGTGHTCSLSGTGNFGSLAISTWSGTAAASVLDQSSGASSAGTGGDLQPGSLTPAANNYLVVTSGGANDTWSALTDSVNPTAIDALNTVTATGNHQAIAHGYTIQTTAAAVNPTWGTGLTDSKEVMQAIFKVASASATTEWAQPLSQPSTHYLPDRIMARVQRTWRRRDRIFLPAYAYSL